MQFESREWIALWTLLTGATDNAIKCPVMTRWECVGEAAEHVTKNREEWRTVATYVVTKEKKTQQNIP